MQLSPGCLIEYAWNGTQPLWPQFDMHRHAAIMDNPITPPDGVEMSIVVAFFPARPPQAPVAYVVLPNTMGWMFVWGHDATYPGAKRLHSVMEAS